MTEENSNHIDLLVAATANGAGVAVKINISEAAVFCWGDFGAIPTKVKLQASPDNVEFFDHADGIFQEKKWVNASFGEVWVRGFVEDADGATNVNLSIRPRIPAVSNL